MKTLYAALAVMATLSGCISSSNPPAPEKTTTVVVPPNNQTTVVCTGNAQPPCN